MPETYTSILKLKQPQVGASTNTWGNTLNVNIDGIDELYRDRGGKPLTSSDGHAYAYDPAYKGGSSVEGDPDYVHLASNMFIRVRIARDNEGAISIDYDNKGAKPVRKFVDGKFVHVANGDLPLNYYAEFVYTAGGVLTDAITEPPVTDDAGSILLNPAPAAGTPENDIAAINQLCAHRNLSVEGIDDLHLRVKADTVVLRKTDATKTKKYSGGIQIDIDIKQSGAGGLQGAGLATNTWYTIYLIGKEDDNTISAIMSPTNGGPGPLGGRWTGTFVFNGVSTNTVPALPGGYSYYGFVGCARTRSGTGGEDPIVLVDFHQAGNMVTIMDLTGKPANKADNNYSAVTLDLCPAEALAVQLGVSIAVPPAAAGTLPKDVPIVPVGVRIAPQGGGVNPSIGEIGINGVNVLQTQVTVGLRTASKVYARTTNTTPATSINNFDLRVNGFYL